MDYTKAAKRAIQDALHHSSIVMFRSIDISHEQMDVRVTIAVQEPDKLDIAALEAELPRGNASVTAVEGGLNVHDADNDQTHVIATAAIEAFVPINPADWVIKG
jgi:uncharacterized protein (TIGR02058 family)